jgi:hypothetical protein
MPVPAVSGSSGAPATPMTVIGRALNVKGGPIVLDENGTRTWVDLPGEWPPSVVGQRVVVEGQLEKRIGPLPTDGTKPLVQAITGDYWILTKVRYRQE